jgi:hypothetical protein
MDGRPKKPQVGRRRWGCGRLVPALLALWRPVLRWALAAGLLVQAAGCTRSFYRKSADEEVSEVLAQKDKYPAWSIDNWHVYPDPRSRFADTSPPDRPAKPPDDPAAHALSPDPQKPYKAGVARIEGTGYLELIAQWDRENRERRAREEEEEKKKETEPPEAADGPIVPKVDADPRAVPPEGPKAAPAGDGAMMQGVGIRDAIEEARARSLIDISGRPTYLMTLDQAAELAMFNSREYQDQRETLYLAALPVTQERFSFTAQFFAAQEAARSYFGRNTPEGQKSQWTINSGAGFAKVLPTGALLLFNLANQTVFNFLNPKNVSSVTTLNFAAIQPLLRGGGEAVALESLTQAERTLLYAIRNFARFRKELYVEIASNNGGSIAGGAFQPSGVLASGGLVATARLGALGETPGVIAPVALTRNSPIVPPNTPGALALAAALTPPPSGYLNTMLQKIQVYIDQENVDILIGILQRFRGLLEGDVVQPLQVQNVEQQLLAGKATLLTDQEQYLLSLDSFKLEVGVPMRLNIELDDSVLRPLINQFRRARAIIDNEQAAVAEATALIDLEKAPRLRAELLRLFQRSALVRGTPFARRIRDRLGEWERLLNKELNDRLAALKKEADQLVEEGKLAQKKGKSLSPADAARLKSLGDQIDLGSLERALRLYEAAYVENGKPKKPDAAGERQRIRQFQNVVSAWQKVLVEARDNRWDEVRAKWPDLPRCCVDGVDLIAADLNGAQATAAKHALENRLDLMNIRAQVVDSWRQIAVFANALLGVFNVRYQLTSNSPLGVAQPTNIGGSGNAHQLILDTELPLTRLTERNNYRASLIAFNRQRRALQEAEDLAVRAVQDELYALRLFADQYKLQQRQLELAYLTIDSSLESLQAPVSPGKSAADGPAALTQQLLTAQRSLPTAQNALLTLWINYLNARLQLYRDLELMPLDARGVWIDEIRDCDCGVGLEPPAGGERLPEPRPMPPAGVERLPEPRPMPPAGDRLPPPTPKPPAADPLLEPPPPPPMSGQGGK